MRRWLLAVLLAISGRAAAQNRGFATPEIYPAASSAWAAAIGGALARPSAGAALSPALAPLTSPNLTPTAAFAPVAMHLQKSLGMKPAAFAALPAAEQHAALDLAVDAARGELQQKAYELDSQSRALSAPERTLDKDDRAELFRVVANLKELRGRYAPFLDDATRELVAQSYDRALLRAVQVRDALIGRKAEDLSGTFNDSARGASAEAAAADADPRLIPAAPRALKLYEQMSESTAGWGADDVDALLTGYGFVRRDGKHRNYSHPDFPTLHDSYSHQRQLKDIYIKSALRMVRELARLRARAAGPASASPAGAPDLSHVHLEDLTALLTPPKPAAPKPVRPERAARARVADEPVLAAPLPVAPAESASAAAAAPTAARETTARLAPATPRPAAVKEEPPAPAEEAAPERSNASSWMRKLLGLDR
jgi:hypothetical protein